MVVTSYTTGLLTFALLCSPTLSVPAAELLLWLYRRSVQRGMTTASPDDEPSRPERHTALVNAARRPALRVVDYNAPDACRIGRQGRFHDSERSLRHAV